VDVLVPQSREKPATVGVEHVVPDLGPDVRRDLDDPVADDAHVHLTVGGGTVTDRDDPHPADEQ
jgi:hypothetical protein